MSTSHALNLTEGQEVHREAELSETEIVTRYRPTLIRMLIRLTDDASRAEDMAHETLIIVLQHIRKGSIRDQSALQSFIFNTGKFHYIGWMRRYGNQVRLVENCDTFEVDVKVAEEERFDDEQRDIIATSLGKLGRERDRDILTRHYLEDQSKSEICDAMELSTEQFDRVLSRARMRLRENVEICMAAE